MAKKGMKKGSKCVRFKRTRAGKKCADYRSKR